MIDRTRGAALIGMAVLTLAACGGSDASEPTDRSNAPSRPARGNTPDSEAFLPAVGFNEPLTVSVRPAGIADLEPTGIRHFYFDGTKSLGIVSLLARTGRVRIVPDPSRRPWWRMDAPGTNAQGDLTVVIGQRVVTGRSNRQSWSEGSAKYFAETITYTVKRSPDIAVAGVSDFGPFSFRLVLVNHPAAGQWQVDGGATQRAGGEREQIIRQISEEGVAELGALADKIRAARDAATAQQARDRVSGPALPAGGPVSIGPYPNTVLSKNGTLVWYTGVIDLTGRKWRDLDQLCATVPIPQVSNWRAPWENEVRTLFSQSQGAEPQFHLPGPRALTPAVPPYVSMGPNGVHPHLNIVFRDLFTYNGQPTTLDQVERGSIYHVYWFNRWTREPFSRQHSITHTPGDRPLGTADRLLCVAER